MMYAHRNGEAEPPTDAGTYWFMGRVKTARDKSGGFATAGDGEAVLFDGDSMWFQGENHGYHPRYCIGYWWGPVVPPWETDTP